MKKFKIVKIQIDEKTEKEFSVKELDVGEIINLSQQNPLFGGALNDSEKTPMGKEDKGMFSEFTGISKSIEKVMELSCDFNKDDLKKLAPSDVKTLFDEWKEVNSTFLNLLDQIGVIKASKDILKKAMNDFSKMLAI